MRALSLLRNDRGIAATEFALIAPIFALLMMGSADIAHTLYMQTVLQGTIQKAARDSSLESGTATATQTTIDGRIRAEVKKLHRPVAITRNPQVCRVNTLHRDIALTAAQANRQRARRAEIPGCGGVDFKRGAVVRPRAQRV